MQNNPYFCDSQTEEFGAASQSVHCLDEAIYPLRRTEGGSVFCAHSQLRVI